MSHPEKKPAESRPPTQRLNDQRLRRVVQFESFESANEVIFISEADTGKTLRIILAGDEQHSA